MCSAFLLEENAGAMVSCGGSFAFSCLYVFQMVQSLALLSKAPLYVQIVTSDELCLRFNCSVD